MSSHVGGRVLEFFQSLVTPYDNIELGGVHYCREIQPFAKGSYGTVYRVYPRDKWGMPDKKIPLAAKYQNSEKNSDALLHTAVTEADKHQFIFDNKVYPLENGWVVTLMPLFPGEPLLRYDEDLQQDIVHEKLSALTPSQRLELCALVVQTYAEFYANRVDRDGLQHTDLKPENILIEIKIDKKGRAFFQCNIIDFGDTARTPINQAPEDLGQDCAHDSRMAVYSLTAVIAVILGETAPYRYKESALSLEMALSAPFYLENMGKFLCQAMKPYSTIVLNNTVDAAVNIAQSIGILPEGASAEKLLESMSPRELMIKIIVDMAIKNGKVNFFLGDELEGLAPQALMKELIVNVLSCMGTQDPEARPELLAIAKLFNTLALELRRCEYNIQINPQGCESSKNGHVVKHQEAIIPIRNHLLSHSLPVFFTQPVGESSSSTSSEKEEVGTVSMASRMSNL